MKRFFTLFVVAALVAPLAHADPVTAGTVRVLLPSSAGSNQARPSVASTPAGQSVVAWVSFAASGARTLQVAFLDRDGSILMAPTTLSLGTLNPVNCDTAATPTGFMVAYDADTTATVGFRNIYYRTFDVNGLQTGSGQVNSTQSLDNSRPRAAGRLNGDFIVTWVRRNSFGSLPSAGIFMRRFSSTGFPIDGNDVRVDDPLVLNFNRQDGPDVGVWPSGRVVVAWTDGTFGSVPSPTNSPDGQGQGILCRFFDQNLTPVGPAAVANATTVDDQFEPLVAVDQRDRCIIGWCGDVQPTVVDAWVRRFNDQGTPLDSTDLNLTPSNFGTNTFIWGVAATASGEWFATWYDDLATTGQIRPRVGYARLRQDRTVISSDVLQSGGSAAETHGFPQVACDEYGNFTVAWEVAITGGGREVRAQRLARRMISFSSNTPPVGTTLIITLDSPSDGGSNYILGCSGGNAPFAVDSRNVKLTNDALLDYVVFQGNGAAGPIFFNFFGNLNATGTTSTAAVVIPSLPQLSGVTVHFAFATGGGASVPSGVNTISDTYSVTVL